MSVEALADKLGVAEDGLRLILGMMLAYPVMLVHNLFLKHKSATLQHIYFVLTGILLAYWTLGVNCLMHTSICIVTTFLVLKLFGSNFQSTAFIFMFQMFYLSAGYISQSSIEYVVNWTMPHCVLCLRLIGVAMDCYDGSRPEESLSKDQKLSKLTEVPSLLEMFSHVFYSGSYFVGPQHSMTKFRRFIQRNIEDGDMTGSISFGVKRLMLGWVYIGIHLALNMLVPTNYILSEGFKELPLWKMYLLLTVWVKGILAKYIAAWLFSEGACVLSGLAYDGRKDDGSILWSAGANVKLRKYEYCYTFGIVIESFNINTNAWCMNYIYKRMRFLNNKFYSQVITMVFLAVWHGFHSGYYITFLNEILVMQFEKQFFSMCSKSPLIKQLTQNETTNFLLKIVGKIYVLFFLPHCFMPFACLKSDIYLPLLWTTKAPVFLFYGTWPLWKNIAAMVLKPVRSAQSNELNSKVDKTD